MKVFPVYKFYYNNSCLFCKVPFHISLSLHKDYYLLKYTQANLLLLYELLREKTTMGMHKIAKMPSPEELKEEMPLSEEAKQIKAARDKEIRDVFTGASDKFLVIIGPCSADNETAVMDYLGRLARVQKDLADKLLIIPRIYTNKPQYNR